MGASEVILIRHGESLFNRAYRVTREDPGFVDPGLTADGTRQASAAATSMRMNATSGARAPNRILVSPYRRTLETAQIIAKVLEIPVTVEPLIRERAAFMCDIGSCRSELALVWPGLSFDRLEECWWHGSPADGVEETEEALQDRCKRFRWAMAERDNWRRTLVVTHWGFIRGLTGHRVQNCQALRFDPVTGDSALHDDPG